MIGSEPKVIAGACMAFLCFLSPPGRCEAFQEPDEAGRDFNKNHYQAPTIYLNGVKKISDELAWKLASSDAAQVLLDDLEEISDRQMAILASGERQIIRLTKISKINPYQAECIGKSRKFFVLDGVKKLSSNVLSKLTSHPTNTDSLALNGLESLSVDEAKKLSKINRSLELNGLKTISNDCIVNLGNRRSIKFNGIKTLSDQAFFSLLRFNPDSTIYLNGLEELGDEKAEMMGKVKATLHLGGIKRLSEEQFVHMAPGGFVELENLEELSKSQIKVFLKRPPAMRFGNTKIITPDIAEHMLGESGTVHYNQAKVIDQPLFAAIGLFCTHKLDLSFDSLQELSAEQATQLGKCCGRLSLKGLKKLSPDVAMHLREFLGALDLSGLKALDKKTAQHLGQHIGFLNLNGLTELDPSTTKDLGIHTGGLSLNGLKSLSDESFENLFHFGRMFEYGIEEGGLRRTLVDGYENRFNILRRKIFYGMRADDPAYEYFDDYLSINGITKLSSNQCRVIARKNYHVGLRSISSLSDDQLDQVAPVKFPLSLTALEAISDHQAAELGKHTFPLSLPSVRSITENQLRSLLHHKGTLDLSGITEISDFEVAMLSEFPHDLKLNGIKNLTPKQASAFAARKKGTVELKGLIQAAPAIFAILKENENIRLFHVSGS